MIKTQVITEARKELDFPILMESVVSNKIVLFTSNSTGTVVKEAFLATPKPFEDLKVLEPSPDLGRYSRDWMDASNHAYWKVFEGELKLSND